MHFVVYLVLDQDEASETCAEFNRSIPLWLDSCLEDSWLKKILLILLKSKFLLKNLAHDDGALILSICNSDCYSVLCVESEFFFQVFYLK